MAYHNLAAVPVNGLAAMRGYTPPVGGAQCVVGLLEYID